MLDAETTSYIARVLIGCTFLGSLFGIFLAHKFPIRKRVIKIRDEKKC